MPAAVMQNITRLENENRREPKTATGTSGTATRRCRTTNSTTSATAAMPSPPEVRPSQPTCGTWVIAYTPVIKPAVIRTAPTASTPARRP